jgi:hypothetical protein
MSFLGDLKVAEDAGTINKLPIKDIPKSCCPDCELEVFDLDAYSHSRGKETPASCDGLWVGEINEFVMGALIEMKGLCEVQIDFHFRKIKKKVGSDDPQATVAAFREEYREFLEKKLNDFDIKGKIVGSNQLLDELAPTFSVELRNGTAKERVFVLCNLDRAEFNSYRQLLNRVLRPLASERWGVPQAIPCYKLPNEAALVEKLK